MKKILFLIIVGVGTIIAATSASATTFTYPLNFEYTEGTEPEGSPPWLVAEITDTGLPANTVMITMSAEGLTGAEFVSGWDFNWDLAGDSSIFWDFVFQAEDSSSPAASGPAVSKDSFKAGGDMGDGFDIYFEFPNPNNPASDRFGAGERAVYIVELLEEFNYPEGLLTASSFDFLNTAGNFYTAAHVQGIGENNNLSGWIGAERSIAAIPEPATIILIGTGLASLFCIRRFRFKNN